jgi:hypothetical protein
VRREASSIEERTMTANVASPAGASHRRAAGPGRTLAIVAAVFLVLIGLSLAVGGAAVMAVFGTDGEITSSQHPVVTPTAAVVTDIAAIRDTSDVADALGTPVARLTADGGNASGLFVGIGPAAEVDAYLSGVEIDQAVNFEVDPYQLDLSRQDGTETTAAPPADQNFWVASGTGADIDVSWAVADGDYRAVLMNADGAAGVDSRLGIGVGLGSIFGIGLGLVLGGAVLVVVAIALLVVTRPRTQPPAGPTFAYPAAGNGPLSGTAGPAGYPPPAGRPQASYPPPAGNAAPAGYPPPTPAAPHSPPRGNSVPTGYPPPVGNAPPPPNPTPPVPEPMP